jgi:hypothetical protein
LKDDLSSITDPSKFVGTDFFSKSLDFTLMVKRLEQHIKRHAMNSCFTILNVEERVAAISGAYWIFLRDNNTVDLFENYSTL